MSLYSQVKSLKGIPMRTVESNVKDFTIRNDRRAYELVGNLTEECDSLKPLTSDILGDDAILGYYFFCKEYDVIYILKKGGTVLGSVIKRREILVE